MTQKTVQVDLTAQQLQDLSRGRDLSTVGQGIACVVCFGLQPEVAEAPSRHADWCWVGKALSELPAVRIRYAVEENNAALAAYLRDVTEIPRFFKAVVLRRVRATGEAEVKTEVVALFKTHFSAKLFADSQNAEVVKLYGQEVNA